MKKHEINETVISSLKLRIPKVWSNTHYTADAEALLPDGHSFAESQQFWLRCQPLLKTLFDCENFQSPLLPIDTYRSMFCSYFPAGRLLLKADNQLPITGSVKSRGGLYELISHAVNLAEQQGIVVGEQLEGLLTEEAKAYFSQHKILVGSTGNLGLSIGKIGRALGFQVAVHMSSDAKIWKKILLKEAGAEIVSHQGDYSLAVAEARSLAANDDNAYFVDDENSPLLMCGYAQGAFELQLQLSAMGITPSEDWPLVVVIPCGVGGAPVGISLGLKHVFGRAVHPVFVEPVNAPCFGLALTTNEVSPISSIGLSGITQADGLAVGCASELAFSQGKEHIAASATVHDALLFPCLLRLYQYEALRLEPSAAAGLGVLDPLIASEAVPNINRSTIVLWSTGGGLVPELEFKEYLERGL